MFGNLTTQALAFQAIISSIQGPNITGSFNGSVSGAPVTGFADGGISYGPQLAYVSEGRYSAEAHVPLPDGRRIPVAIRGGGDSKAVLRLSTSYPPLIHTLVSFDEYINIYI